MNPQTLTLPNVTEFIRRFDKARGMDHTPDYTAQISAAPTENLHQWLSDGMGGPEFLEAIRNELHKRRENQ